MQPQRDRVVIIGAGGHAKVVIDIIRTQNRYDIIGCLDQEEKVGRLVAGVKIIGSDNMLESITKNGVKRAFIAIGDNRMRKELAGRVRGLGFDLVNAISPFAYISDAAVLQEGIAIMPGAVINAGTIVMSNVIINTKAAVDHGCVVEANCHIGPGCTLAGNVHVGEGAFLGIGTNVIPQVSIGCWSITGAGSVIVTDIVDNTLVLGVPGRAVKKVRQGDGHEYTGCSTEV